VTRRGRAPRIAVRACLAVPVICIAVVLPASAGPGDAESGRLKARQCVVCHGHDGIGRNPEVPHIAGESEFYLTKQLRAFRSGERVHPQMSIVAKGLSDDDIDDLAAYYASIKIAVELPEN